jgi:hypothetical protein
MFCLANFASKVSFSMKGKKLFPVHINLVPYRISFGEFNVVALFPVLAQFTIPFFGRYCTVQ